MSEHEGDDSSATWPDCDEIQLGNYETVGELMIALKSELALPVILVSQGGQARQLVKTENRDAIIQGLLLAIEHRMEVGE